VYLVNSSFLKKTGKVKEQVTEEFAESA